MKHCNCDIDFKCEYCMDNEEDEINLLRWEYMRYSGRYENGILFDVRELN